MRPFALSLAVCLLLSGCAPQMPPAEPSQPLPAPSAELSPVCDTLYPGDPPAEGAFRQWPLPREITGFVPLGEQLLFLCGKTDTTLLLTDPAAGTVLARRETGAALSAADGTVQAVAEGAAFYDAPAGELVVLDSTLQQRQCIPVPEEIRGIPLLSPDAGQLYYCTEDAIRVLETGTGISRVLKQIQDPTLTLVKLFPEICALQILRETAAGSCTQILSSRNGQLLEELEGEAVLSLRESRQQAVIREGGCQILLYRLEDGRLLALRPEEKESRLFPLPDLPGAVGLSREKLTLYDLTEGCAADFIPVPELTDPVCLWGSGGYVWLLAHRDGTPRLICWNPGKDAPEDPKSLSAPYRTREDPDEAGLAQCAGAARALQEALGISLRIGREALEPCPPGFSLEEEYQVPVLLRELEALQEALGSLPPEFPEKLSGAYTAVNIRLVRSICPEGGTGSLDALSFLDGYDAHILLTGRPGAQEALWRELSLLMETVVLTHSTAYDRWENLNPGEFSYGRAEPDPRWLQADRAYFVSQGAMAAPREDRAALFARAMMPGQEAVFRSEHLQAKLELMCRGIREAFDLENHPAPLPWEQYLRS